MADVSGFRRSHNMEDRRKDKRPDLNVWPRSELMLPNVFEDNGGLLTGLPADSFATQPKRPTNLSVQAGANMLQSLLDKYFTDRQGSNDVQDNQPQMFDIFR